MRVILLQDIKTLGRRGDVKNVADGYARNFLLPKKLVRPATAAALEEVESWKEKLAKQLQETALEMEKVEKETSVTPLAFTVKVGERGEVFSSVGAEEIKEKFIASYPALGEFNPRIETDHLKKLGRQEIRVKLDRGVEGKFTIEVGPQPL